MKAIKKLRPMGLFTINSGRDNNSERNNILLYQAAQIYVKLEPRNGYYDWEFKDCPDFRNLCKQSEHLD